MLVLVHAVADDLVDKLFLVGMQRIAVAQVDGQLAKKLTGFAVVKFLTEGTTITRLLLFVMEINIRIVRPQLQYLY